MNRFNPAFETEFNPKILFVDYEKTLLTFPESKRQQTYSYYFSLPRRVISALLLLKKNFSLFEIQDQESSFCLHSDKTIDESLKRTARTIFTSQGVVFDRKLLYSNRCLVDSNNTGQRNFLHAWLARNSIDLHHSYIISDQVTCEQSLKRIEVKKIAYQTKHREWTNIEDKIRSRDRHAVVHRVTKETDVLASVWLDRKKESILNTGVRFLDHMLRQIVVHAGVSIELVVKGDVHVDDHHTVEDTALSLGTALRRALRNKKGVSRFGFVLPMDECRARCILDLSDRPYLRYQAEYDFQHVGDLSTEMIRHFFHSLSYSLRCSIHLQTQGSNDHHKAESLFKVFGQTLKQAVKITLDYLPSTKGTL